jgi:hypothetical protein
LGTRNRASAARTRWLSPGSCIAFPALPNYQFV